MLRTMLRRAAHRTDRAPFPRFCSSDAKERFVAAVAANRKLLPTLKLHGKEKLELNALYMQATYGDNPDYVYEDWIGLRPSQDAKAEAEFDAWAKLEGMPSEKAMAEYLELTNTLAEELGNVQSY